VKPEVAQCADHDGEISSTVGTEQAGDVLKDQPSAWSKKLIGAPGELEEQARSLPFDTSAFAGDAPVLTGDAAAEHVDRRDNPGPDIPDIRHAKHVRPVLLKNALAVRVDLALPHATHTCSLEAEIEASHAAEDAADTHYPSLR
jgi:hypothetical protein